MIESSITAFTWTLREDCFFISTDVLCSLNQTCKETYGWWAFVLQVKKTKIISLYERLDRDKQRMKHTQFWVICCICSCVFSIYRRILLPFLLRLFSCLSWHEFRHWEDTVNIPGKWNRTRCVGWNELYNVFDLLPHIRIFSPRTHTRCVSLSRGFPVLEDTHPVTSLLRLFLLQWLLSCD